MLTESYRDPAFALLADIGAPETKSAPRAALHSPPRVRRTLADRVSAAVKALAADQGALLSHRETAWASITFAGTRHQLVFEFCGAAAVAAGEELIERLPDYEFAIPGQLVADATITAVDHRFGAMERLEVTAVLLLLEEG